jgi:hypothetical protein
MRMATEVQPISVATQMNRSRGRSGRTYSANVKLTRNELSDLETVARAEEKAVGEWAREVLLREARGSQESAVFTELVATRMLLVNLIKPLVLGEKVTAAWITEAMTMVRKEKYKAAQEVMQQYTQPVGKE